jgi:cell migration-inducing and hyaluronan-binding protein
MVGNVMQSYAIGNSIHDSNNRAITIHGVNYLTIADNVAYNIKGHSIFIEDGVERRNFI